MPYWFWCYNFVLTCCLPVLSGSWSSLPQVMSWCQPVSGHYPCQYWLIMNWFKTGTTTMPYWFWCYNFVLTCWDIRHPDKLLIECSGIAWPFTPGKPLSSRVSNDLTLTWVWGCDCWVPLNGMAPGETPATRITARKHESPNHRLKSLHTTRIETTGQKLIGGWQVYFRVS